MKTNNSILKIIAISSLLMLASCKGSPTIIPEQQKDIKQFISYYGYTPFQYANSTYDPLTIMKLSRGASREIIADPEDCVEMNNPRLVSKGDVALLKTSYTVDSEQNASLVVPKELLRFLDLSSSFQNSKFRKVNIELVDPFVNYVSRIRAQRVFREAPDDCKDVASNQDNLIIHGVVGAKGVKYTIELDRETQGEFKARILDKIEANSDFSTKIDAEGSIIVDKQMYFGYTAFKGRFESGMGANGEFEVLEISKDQVSQVKGRVN